MRGRGEGVTSPHHTPCSITTYVEIWMRWGGSQLGPETLMYIKLPMYLFYYMVCDIVNLRR